MKTIDLYKTKKLVLSVEFFPPKKSGTMETVIRALKDAKAVEPDFVSITYGASGTGGDGTADVASVAKDALEMEPVVHLTCVNMTIEKLEEKLETYQRKGVENILVLRGDIVEDSRFYDFKHASELAEYIKKHYPDFNLLGACYPECHYAAKSLDEDIDNLKRKVDAGVAQLVTQLFFDNSHFYNFINKIRAKGINVPVEAGIMPVFQGSKIQRMVSLSGASLPQSVTRLIAKYDGTDQMLPAAIDYTLSQCNDLIANGASGIHLYGMNRGDVIKSVFDGLRSVRSEKNG